MEYYKNFDLNDIVYFCEFDQIWKTEQWKDVVGYEELYKVSDLGRVKSLSRIVFKTKNVSYVRKERILKPQKDKKGYFSVINFKIHRLVSQAFIPNPENKPQINHINCIKTDNRVKNLEWVNNSENQKHAFLYGLQCNKGIKHPMCKFSEKEILEIRDLYKKITNIEIAILYNTNRHHISSICKRKIWKHI